MRLMYDRVAVEVEETKTETKSGLALPDSAQPKENIGKVVAVGDGLWQNGVRCQMTVQVGDKVLFSKAQTFESELNGTKVLIMGEGSIIAILGGIK